MMKDDHGQRTASVFARTCKTFVEASLDALWYHQGRGLVPLLKTFPADLWEVSRGSLFFTRQLVGPDWTRFNYYAQRIRILSIGFNVLLGHSVGFPRPGEIDIDAGSLDAMKQSGHLLLCNLRQIDFSSDHDSVKLVGLILMPTVKTIHLDFASEIFAPSEAAALFAAIKCRSPSLEHVQLCGIPKAFCPTVSQFVCGCRNLRTFMSGHSGHGITDEALIHLASLPTISKLTLSLKKNSRSLTFPPLSFIGLRDLAIQTSRAMIVIDLLKSHHSLPLCSLTLDINGFAGHTELMELFCVMGDHCAHAELTRLILRADHGIPDSFLYPDVLRPILCFTNLANVDIDCTSSFANIDNKLLEEMARAWPRLERLTLGLNMSTGHSSEVTLAGLVPLARYCPKLEFFSMAFNASKMERPGTKFQNCKLSRLGVGCSNIEDVRTVAEFLSDIFPNLQSIFCRAPSIPDKHHTEIQNRQHAVRWQMVVEILSGTRENR